MLHIQNTITPLNKRKKMSSTSSPKKRYSFGRWKKIDLLDLADKLNIYMPTSAKKDAIILAVEEYLRGLQAPLDTLEYPELSQYYNALKGEESDTEGDRSRLRIRPKIEDIDSTLLSKESSLSEDSMLGDSSTEPKEEVLPVVKDNDPTSYKTKKKYFNNLFFGKEKANAVKNKFKFNFHERFTDIVNKTSECNEKVQNYLANLDTVYKVFVIIELISLLRGIFKSLRIEHNINPVIDIKEHLTEDFIPKLMYGEILLVLLIWTVLYIAIPVLIAYYFNFARDVYGLDIDQMVYNLAKLLVVYFIRSSPLSNDDKSEFFNFVNNLISKSLGLNRFSYYMDIITDSLGNQPFIFSIVSSVLTIYVYILYVL